MVNDIGYGRDGTGESSTRHADEVVEEIRAAGGKAVANYDSVASVEGGQNIVAAAMEAFGRLDILINNAAILRDKSFAKMGADHWGAVLDVQLNGAFYVTQPAFTRMREGRYGRIVMTTSSVGLYGNFGQANYAAAKMGLIGLMNALKIEGAKYDIKVNAVSPTALTRVTKDVFPPDLAAISDPRYVSPLVLLLCSERCPVTGQIYRAGMGHYSRAALLTGKGVVLGGGRPPTPEEVFEAMEAIADLSEARELENTGQSLKHALSALGAEGAGLVRPT